MPRTLEDRTNFALETSERWRPPIHVRPDTKGRRWLAAARRLFDVQAGSIWRDLGEQLGKASGVVLDVGCGAQPYRPLIPPDVTYIGIDTTDAAENFGYRVPDTVYFDGDTWPIDSGSVDVVLCAETLEHVLEPQKLLSEAHRVLAADGSILVTVPFSARWHFIPHDYWRFTPSSLKSLLEGAGFSEVAVYARGNAFTVACYKTMALALPFLFPASRTLRSSMAQILALLAVPVLTLLAVAAQLSLRGDGGQDCLGYTVSASRA